MDRRFQPIVYCDYYDDDNTIESDDTYLEHYLGDDFQYESSCSVDEEKSTVEKATTSKKISTKGYNKILLIPLKSFESCHIKENKTRFETSIQATPKLIVRDAVAFNDRRYNNGNRYKHRDSNAQKVRMTMSPDKFKEVFGHSLRDSFEALKTSSNGRTRRISVVIRNEPYDAPLSSDADEGWFLQDIYEDSDGIHTQSEYNVIRRKQSGATTDIKQRKERIRKIGTKPSLQTVDELNGSSSKTKNAWEQTFNKTTESDHAGACGKNDARFEEERSFNDDVQNEVERSRIEESRKSSRTSVVRKPSLTITELMRKYSISTNT